MEYVMVQLAPAPVKIQPLMGLFASIGTIALRSLVFNQDALIQVLVTRTLASASALSPFLVQSVGDLHRV